MTAILEANSQSERFKNTNSCSGYWCAIALIELPTSPLPPVTAMRIIEYYTFLILNEFNIINLLLLMKLSVGFK